MNRRATRYSGALPALLLLAGVMGKSAVQPERSIPLRMSLQGFPEQVEGYTETGSETLSTAEVRILRPDDYLLRTYRNQHGADLTLFIAYYGRQLGGSSIHSPRNCLPGSGWEPVQHERIRTSTVYGEGQVNRYIVEHKSGARALVFYWYQGRGRVAANEYAVKWDLLRDAVLKRRTDEALVRVLFPLRAGEDIAESFSSADAEEAVREVARILAEHLPS